MAAWIAPAISAASGFLQGMFSRKQSYSNVERTNKANMEMAKFAYSKDFEMWNRQNQYNKPMEQMRRLKEAGLNPNLIYGSGSPTGNTSGQMPKYQAPKQDYTGRLPVKLPDMLSEYQNFQLGRAQIQKTMAETKLIEEREGATSEGAFATWLRNEATQASRGTKSHYAGSQFEELAQRKFQADIDVASEKANAIKLKNAFQQGINQLQKAGLATADSPQFKAAVLMMLQEGMPMAQIRGSVIAAGISGHVFDKMVNKYSISGINRSQSGFSRYDMRSKRFNPKLK